MPLPFHHPSRFAPLLLPALLACGPKTLDTYVQHQKSVTLRAEATKVEGGWEVRLPLPAGAWKVEAEEAQAFTLEAGTPRAVMVWKVSPERWKQQDRPFRFALLDPSGGRIPLSVKYPDVLGKGSRFVLEFVASLVAVR